MSPKDFQRAKQYIVLATKPDSVEERAMINLFAHLAGGEYGDLAEIVEYARKCTGSGVVVPL